MNFNFHPGPAQLEHALGGGLCSPFDVCGVFFFFLLIWMRGGDLSRIIHVSGTTDSGTGSFIMTHLAIPGKFKAEGL